MDPYLVYQILLLHLLYINFTHVQRMIMPPQVTFTVKDFQCIPQELLSLPITHTFLFHFQSMPHYNGSRLQSSPPNGHQQFMKRSTLGQQILFLLGWSSLRIGFVSPSLYSSCWYWETIKHTLEFLLLSILPLQISFQFVLAKLTT